MQTPKETAMLAAIDRANQLSHAIDMAAEYPEQLIIEWQLQVEWLQDLGMPYEYLDWFVIYPENW